MIIPMLFPDSNFDVHRNPLEPKLCYISCKDPCMIELLFSIMNQIPSCIWALSFVSSFLYLYMCLTTTWSIRSVRLCTSMRLKLNFEFIYFSTKKIKTFNLSKILHFSDSPGYACIFKTIIFLKRIKKWVFVLIYF